jgi:ADP-ribosylglycohydrolase
LAVLSREERIRGALYGLLVGDALGVPYEFAPREQIPEQSVIELSPPKDFCRAHGGVPAGTWSDDGAQALCLLASLLHQGRFDVADFAARVVDWFDSGYMAVDAAVFDVGVQTRIALERIREGVPALEAAEDHERANGNGSLMRVLPLALFHTGSEAELVRDAHLQSRVTHAHPRSEVCCALYCLWARFELAGDEAAYENAVDSLREIYVAGSPHAHELEHGVRPDREPGGNGSGYVVDCLHSARLAVAESSYEAVVRRAIAFGDDTDTTAAVAGGIAGIRFGFSGIPQRWLAGLRGRDLVDPLARALVDAAS